MNILIVGVGGIGSYVVDYIYGLIIAEQLPFNTRVYIADDDEVEVKNLKYQNFREEELNMQKVYALKDYYDLLVETQPFKNNYGSDWLVPMSNRVDFIDWDEYDVVVGAVDNVKFRKQLFNSYFDYAKNRDEDTLVRKMWFDLRAEGRIIVAFTKNPKNTLEFLLNQTQGDEEESTSCQRAFELEQGWIQQGNKLIALYFSQWLLDYFRGNTHEIPAVFHALL